MEVVDVVRKLIGPIDPVGESHIDEKRYENLKAMTEIVDKLLGDIDDVVCDNKDRHEASMKKAADFGSKFFDKVGITNCDAITEMCELGHKFPKFKDHPKRDKMALCPHCMAEGNDRMRKELEKHE